jgi:hypothetical protein
MESSYEIPSIFAEIILYKPYDFCQVSQHHGGGTSLRPGVCGDNREAVVQSLSVKETGYALHHGGAALAGSVV